MSERQFSFRAMNTNVMIWLDANQGVSSKEIVEVFEDTRLLFDQVEQTCSRFLPDSELVKVNQSPLRAVAVSPMLYELLQAALDAFDETHGLYHPGLLVPLENAGYDRSMELLRAEGAVASLVNMKPWKRSEEPPYELDRHRKSVYLYADRKIDLGGIAKGWAVDRAAKHLGQWGKGFVNAGGDLRVFGHEDAQWNIGVEDPFSPKYDVAVLTVNKGAVATSSTVKRRWKQGTEWKNHLIDPRTGSPTKSEIFSATVTAPTAVQADVWAKVVLLLGMERGIAWIREREQRAVLVDQFRQVRSVESGMVEHR
jgi:FAD:protein FMN transferase